MSGCNLTTKQIAEALEAKLLGADVPVDGVNTDTRSIQAGQLFVALQGPNFDAHDFIAQAEQAGAQALMVNHQVASQLPQIIVEDTLLALGRLAQYWRLSFSIPVVAITGSNGKTTVKELTAAILRQQGDTLATQGNLNNHIGVPLTLLRLESTHKAAVIEMGANHPREIAYLTDIAKPTVAIINNAAAAHLEGFGSLEGVAKAKGEIYQGLLEGGVAIVNADDHFADLWKTLAAHRSLLTFGLEKAADIFCKWHGGVQGSQLDITTPKGNFQCELKLPGQHNVLNALAATSIGVAVGLNVQQLKQGLEDSVTVSGRLQAKSGENGATIIDDTYNANPNSLSAALRVLAQSGGKKILVLGDMGELGDDTLQLHKQAGEDAKAIGVDVLMAVGNFTKETAKAFGSGAFHFSGHAELIDALRMQLAGDVTVLVKGSRMMKMEQVINAVVIDSQNGGVAH